MSDFIFLLPKETILSISPAKMEGKCWAVRYISVAEMESKDIVWELRIFPEHPDVIFLYNHIEVSLLV